VSVRPTPSAAAGARAPSAPNRLRVALLAITSAGALLVLALIAYELALARVPEQRAALEDLIRHESGLNLTFNTLTVRWGWYGPEAVFEGVVLNEPGSAHRLLSAARLRVSLDPWRIVRSGQLEASRIMLDEPDIELTAAAARAAPAGPQPRARAGLLQAGARVLSRWHGEEIEIRDGSVRAQQDGEAVVLQIPYAQLWHLERQWQMSAQLTLPQSLGAAASVGFEMHGDPALPEISTGTLRLEGRRLLFGPWRALLPRSLAARYLPHSGRGDVAVTAAFAHGRIVGAEGSIRAAALEWRVPDATGASAALRLAHLAGHWSLAREGMAWRLRAPSLALAGSRTRAALSVAIAADGSTARGTLAHLPLAGLTGTLAAQLPPVSLLSAGEAREVSFDWSARRPPGARLVFAAQLANVMLADAAREVTLAGLSAQIFGTDTEACGELGADAARFTLKGAADASLGGLAVRSRLRLSRMDGGWELSADELQIHLADMVLSARGRISARQAADPSIDAHLSVRNAEAAILAGLLPPPAALAAGRIDSADVSWHGPLAASPWGAGAQFAGNATVSALRTVGSPSWPEVAGIDARLVWRGARGHADIARAQSGTLQLSAASADWDARAAPVLRFNGTLAGEAGEALAWLRAHPELAAWAPAVAGLDLHGAVRADFRVTVPQVRPAQVRVAAQLQGGALRAVAGLPPIEALRGTLLFDGEHLQRSLLAGQWLGGPVSLTVGEHRTQDGSELAILGHGVLDARRTLIAAGGDPRAAALGGRTEWSARLTFLPDMSGTHWQLRADSSLTGVTSALPEPFAKTAAVALPLHVELTGDRAVGQLRVSLGDRVRGLASLSREADAWRIERGALALAGSAATLPEDRVLTIEGSLGRVDLPAALALLRGASADAALPALRVHLYTGALLAGTYSFGAVRLAAQVAPSGGELQLASAALAGSASWPAQIDRAHPAQVRLAEFALADATDLTLAGGVAAVFAPAAQLSVAALTVAGRPVGAVAALLSSHDDVLEAENLTLTGAPATADGRARCDGLACRLDFELTSPDAAALLGAFGLRPELDAARARLGGELTWSAGAAVPLATLGGHLHMQLEDGATRPAAASEGIPFGLLAVPALLAAAGAGEEQDAPLRFARLAADYELADGVATTRDLHFDGDAEILVRGAVGLAADDYDLEAWILRGADRLPAAVRGLAPTPRVAAAWLSLRDLLGAGGVERTRQALRLRGTWNDPIVTPVDTR
jgi:uncharacterized protein YhdP